MSSLSDSGDSPLSEENDSNIVSSSDESNSVLSDIEPAESVYTYQEMNAEKRKELAKHENDRYLDRKAKQERLMKEVKEYYSKGRGNMRTDPMEILAHQMEIYARYTERGIASIPSSEMDAAPSTTIRRRKMSAEEDMQFTTEAESFSVDHISTQPKCIVNGTMRDYQIEGLNWLVALYDTGINGILADEMGLGKTLQTISLLGYLYETRGIEGPHIIIVPKSTLSNWRKEFEKWCPVLKIVILQGNISERNSVFANYISKRAFNVVITTYEMVLQEQSRLSAVEWLYLVIDEAHRIKNEENKLSIAVRKCSTRYRLLITGTPLQNNVHELWSLLNFLMPSIFMDSAVFDPYMKNSIESDTIHRLHIILRPFLLRRLKEEVAKDLPPKKEIKIYVGLTDSQLNLYKNVLKRDIEALNSISGANRTQLLNIMVQLRKVCNHPYLFPGVEKGPPYFDGPHLWEVCGKMRLLDKLLVKLKEQGSRVLLFSQMTRMLDILQDYVRYKHYTYCRIDGTTTGENRERYMDEFNKPNSSVFIFLLSTRAGGLGINLATADVVILYDSDWNPQADLQAQDRAHRIGQKRMVRVFRLITEHTVEEKIIERAERKLLLDAIIIQQGRLSNSMVKLSSKEVASMVRYGADTILHTSKVTYSNEDIDKILKESEERSIRDMETMKKKMESITELSMNDANEIDIYDFEGENFRGKEPESLFVSLPPRERKSFQLHMGKPRNGMKPNHVQCPYHEYQLYNVDKIKIIMAKEMNNRWNLRAIETKIKRIQQRDSDMKEGMIQELRRKKEYYTLTAEEEEEKKRLQKEGFPNWTHDDYFCFIRACMEIGKSNTAKVIDEVCRRTGHSAIDVTNYMNAFWRKALVKPRFQRIVEKMEKREESMQKKGEIEMLISRRVNQHQLTFRSFAMPTSVPNGRCFSEENDRFLLCALAQMGYGNWDGIKQEIMKCDQFRFDWVFRTRSVIDIQKRCDILIRQLEKEGAASHLGPSVKRSKAPMMGTEQKRRRRKSAYSCLF